MPEIPQHVPKEQLPEYWNGHSADDDCPVQPEDKRFSFEELVAADDHGGEVLRQFLSSGRALTRVFKQGEVVRAQDLNADTVIRFNHERLILARDVEEPYIRDDYWAVVCEAQSGERLIMSYYATHAPDHFHPAFLLPDPFYPEDVMHGRSASPASRPERVERFRDVSVYSAGKTVTERRRLRIPDFRRIFRRQVVNHS